MICIDNSEWMRKWGLLPISITGRGQSNDPSVKGLIATLQGQPEVCS